MDMQVCSPDATEIALERRRDWKMAPCPVPSIPGESRLGTTEHPSRFTENKYSSVPSKASRPGMHSGRIGTVEQGTVDTYCTP